MSLIVVNKIVTKFKEDDSGNLVLNPTTDKPIKDGYKVVEETIRIDEVKSAREYHKSKVHEYVEGDITIVHLYGDLRKNKPADMLINESFQSFNERIGAIKLK